MTCGTSGPWWSRARQRPCTVRVTIGVSHPAGLTLPVVSQPVSSQPPAPPELTRLLDYPFEDLSTEIKGWLDLSLPAERANVVRELIALANHGGGFLLFGFSDGHAGWPYSGVCPYDLSRYSQDAINNALKAHAEPVFECYVYHLMSSADNDHVVVRVPGGHMVPIRSRGAPQGSKLTDHTYYVRRPGPESAPPGSGAEWQALLTRCVDNNTERQLDNFRRIVAVLQTGPDVARRIADVASGSEDPLVDWADESLRRLGDLGRDA